MKQLSSFMVLSINGGDRVSYTFDEINDTTGEPISTNNKQSFFVVDQEMAGAVEVIRKKLRERLADG